MKWCLLIAIAIASNAIAANQRDLDKLMQTQTANVVLRLDLSNTDLRKYPFIAGKIDLQQANISHSNLSGVDLSKMNLGGADLSYADLSHAKLNEVNLIGANLSHANLTGAELQKSDLSRAVLLCANLTQANLRLSTFTEATISGANFTNTITDEIVGYESVHDVKIICD